MPKKHPRLELFTRGGIPPEMKAMAGKVLITGSSGMLGVDLCEELNSDYELYGIDVRGQEPGPRGRNYFVCDITDKDAVAGLLSKIRPEIVIHTAAWTDVDGCELDKKKAYRINSDGTENIASACKNSGAVLIYISTDFVFDGNKKVPYKETDKPGPLSVYADSKLKGEEAIKDILKDYLILRTAWLYGKNGNNFVDTIIEKAGRERELKVVDDQVGSPTYAVDMAKAMHVLLSKIMRQGPEARGQGPGYGIYHVTNSGSVSWYEYARMILRLCGSETRVIPITSAELGRPARRPAMSILDNSRFIEFTGYKLRDWKEALKEYIEKWRR